MWCMCILHLTANQSPSLHCRLRGNPIDRGDYGTALCGALLYSESLGINIRVHTYNGRHTQSNMLTVAHPVILESDF